MRAFLENFRLALAALRGNKLRSFLTMLGIIIGVFQIIVLVGLGQGVKQDVTNEVTQLGTNVLFVIPGKVETSSGGYNPAASVGASTLTDADVAAIRRLPDITDSMVMGLMAAVPTAGSNQAPGSMVIAISSNFLDFMKVYQLVAGRFFTPAEHDAADRVIVLGKDMTATLFPGVPVADVIGQTVSLGKNDFNVLGVVEQQQTNSLFSGSNTSVSIALIPFQTAKAVNPNTQIFRIGVKANDDADAKAVKTELAAKLKELHGADDTTVFTQDDLLKVVDSILDLITKAIVGLASISLVVGGIGIMNIMLVAVTERTKEIGLRKAIGASDGNILAQFLTESIIISLLGGAVGVILATVTSIVVHARFDLSIVVNAGSVLIATAFSLGIGVIFGVAPAIRAARKDPIEALRYE